MAVKTFLKETEEQMHKALNATRREFQEIRSGRANPKIVEGVRVNYYGTPTLLKDIATISIPEARLIVINPWDPSAIKEIEKALLQSDLGITPMNDGKVIRMVVPALSEERREDLIKMVKKIAEEGKVSVRTVRRDAKETIRAMEKEKKISEDDKFKAEEELQKLTDRFIADTDKLLLEKEKELREF